VIRVHVRLFAMLRERAGRSAMDVDLADGATAGDVWAQLGIGEEPPALGVAVNRAYADRSTRLADGDEVAFIPPVSGGAVEPVVALTDDPINLAAVVAVVADPGAGAIATFSGTVRDVSRERDVERLEYEIYAEMAIDELTRIGREAAERHALSGISIVHRGGRCEIGETTVAIACSAPHRGQALDACRDVIEALKQSVPIWKREVYRDGAAWIGQGS
jgi:molybdopterin synthase catalytic subunit/molybdopterin converting factor small subunit